MPSWGYFTVLADFVGCSFLSVDLLFFRRRRSPSLSIKIFIIYTLFADLAALLLNTAATGCHVRWTSGDAGDHFEKYLISGNK